MRTLRLGPQIIDNYVLSGFLFYFALLLASFVLMTHVYTFFELLSDILKNRITMSLVGKYLFYLTPKLVYDSTPVSVLVAVLVTFGILTKNNEVTAMKACGVSLYQARRSGISGRYHCASAGLFAFDHYVDSGCEQDPGCDSRPNQGAAHADISASGSEVDLRNRVPRGFITTSISSPTDGVMVDVHVYELEPDTFGLKRHVFAERARWEPALNAWIFQDGWWRDFETAKNRFTHSKARRPPSRRCRSLRVTS